jgi:hypothetical protein
MDFVGFLPGFEIHVSSKFMPKTAFKRLAVSSSKKSEFGIMICGLYYRETWCVSDLIVCQALCVLCLKDKEPCSALNKLAWDSPKASYLM